MKWWSLHQNLKHFFPFLKTLTWSLHNYPARYVRLSRADVDRTLDKAFKMWQSVAQINFQKLNNNNRQADIIILFASGLHNDPYPFDGRGGTLAHGFYPGSNTGIYIPYNISLSNIHGIKPEVIPATKFLQLAMKSDFSEC